MTDAGADSAVSTTVDGKPNSAFSGPSSPVTRSPLATTPTHPEVGARTTTTPALPCRIHHGGRTGPATWTARSRDESSVGLRATARPPAPPHTSSITSNRWEWSGRSGVKPSPQRSDQDWSGSGGPERNRRSLCQGEGRGFESRRPLQTATPGSFGCIWVPTPIPDASAGQPDGPQKPSSRPGTAQAAEHRSRLRPHPRRQRRGAARPLVPLGLSALVGVDGAPHPIHHRLPSDLPISAISR